MMVDISRGVGGSGSLPPEELWLMANELGKKYNVDPQVVFRMIMQESGGDPSARGGADDLGLMQVTPSAAQDLGIEHSSLEGDPWAQAEAGVRHFANTRDRMGLEPGEDTPRVLSAYNAGVRGSGLGRGQDYAREVMDRPGYEPGIGDYAPSAPAMTADQLPTGGGPGDEMDQLAALGYPPYLHAGGGTGDGPGVDAEAALMARSNVVPGEPSPQGTPIMPEAGGPPADMIQGGVPESALGGPPADMIASGAPPGAPAPLDSPTPDAGAGGGGGLDSASEPRPVGAKPGWREALQAMAIPLAGALSGGRANPMLSFAVGRQKGIAKKRMSEWEQDQKIKFEEDKRAMEDATEIMDQLQGLDLNSMINQAETPEQRAMLEKAANEIDKIAQKYSEMTDPSSEGGSAITAGEARKLRELYYSSRREIAAAQTGQKRLEGGLEAEAFGARASAETEAIMDRTKRLWEIEPQVPHPDGSGQMIPISQALQWGDYLVKKARTDYYSARAGASGAGTTDKFSLADAQATAKVLPMYEMARIAAEKKGDTKLAAFYAQQLAVLRAAVRSATPPGAEAAGLAGGGTSPGAVDQLIADQMANYDLVD